MNLEVNTLKEALEAFTPATPSEHALSIAARDMLDRLQLTEDLREIPDEELLAADNAQLARLSYVTGYLRLLDYLRRSHGDDSRANQFQARLALDFVKHMETTQLSVLQLGRKGVDGKLEQRVNEMRAELHKLAAFKAEAMSIEQET